MNEIITMLNWLHVFEQEKKKRILISLYLIQCKHIKIFRPCIGKQYNSFVCSWTRTISPTYTIFNIKHSIINLCDTHKFQGIQIIFLRTRAHTDEETGR